MTSPVSFLTQTYDELKKVVWPTRQQLMKLMLIVMFASLVVGLYIGGIDFVLTKLTESLLK
ncbi:MAG: preprotein translocase subunit SecE [Candidatus Levybacteria bacterium]|nr:preprotein translocase subunit SecE [Candidatus Levybacteria bacterium]